MTKAGAAARLAVLGLVYGALLPAQLLATRLRLSWQGWPPVVFHRTFLGLFGVRVKVRGDPPDGRPTLVLANHVSWLDIAVLGSLRPLSFIAKAEVDSWPVIGTFARLQRTVFIDRTRRSATAEANERVARRLSAGETIVLFAEGTTGDGKRLLPFRSSLVGAARAALAAPGIGAIDLKPLSIVYARRDGLPVTRRERPSIAWYGSMDLAPHIRLFLRNGPLDAVVTWGEPIPFAADTDRKRATAEAERAVRAGLRPG